MTIHLHLPTDVEKRLRAEVDAGRHATIEQAILEKVGHSDDPDLFRLTGMDAAALRGDLEDAWLDRRAAVDGETFFARLASKNAALKAQSK